MPDLSLPREIGADLDPLACPTCGQTRELAESSYGSLSPAPCAKCSGEPVAAPMAAPVLASVALVSEPGSGVIQGSPASE